MIETSLLEKFLTQTSPVVVFVVGLLWVIWKLGSLAITKYFEKTVPIQERQTVAIEKLASVAERVASDIANEMHVIAVSQRALWQEFEFAREAKSGGQA